MTYQQDDDFDFGADLSTIEDSPEFTPIPAGRYRLMSTSTELKDSSKGQGKYVKVQFVVVDGPCSGRMIFENFNLQHSNPQTVEIAQRRVKQWIAATSFDPNVRLTMGILRDLEGVEFNAHVIIEEDKSGQYGPQNRIKRYEMPASKTGSAADEPKKQTKPEQAKRSPATAGARPWEKK